VLVQFKSAQATVEKAKARFEGCRRKQDSLQSEVSADPQNAKLNKKLMAETKTAEKADEEYKKALEKMKEMEGRFYDSEMPAILKDLEGMEKQRIKTAQSGLTNFVTAQSTVHPKIKSCTETMNGSIQSINPDNDIQSFISTKKTGRSPPPRTEYCPYDPAIQACKTQSSVPSPSPRSPPSSMNPVSGSGSHINSSLKSSGSGPPTGAVPFIRNTPPVPASGLKSPANPGSSFRPPNPALNKPDNAIKVRALFNYTGVEDTELSFKEGDLITVTYKDESGWWEGELAGRVGVFPSNHVDVIGGAPPASSSSAAGEYDKCKALFDYEAEDADELSVHEGDIITVEDEDDEGWYYGTNGQGKYGKFPSNYVELLQ